MQLAAVPGFVVYHCAQQILFRAPPSFKPTTHSPIHSSFCARNSHPPLLLTSEAGNAHSDAFYLSETAMNSVTNSPLHGTEWVVYEGPTDALGSPTALTMTPGAAGPGDEQTSKEKKISSWPVLSSLY